LVLPGLYRMFHRKEDEPATALPEKHAPSPGLTVN
jgi:hypothetical protein